MHRSPEEGLALQKFSESIGRHSALSRARMTARRHCGAPFDRHASAPNIFFLASSAKTQLAKRTLRSCFGTPEFIADIGRKV
jgi:hypothetical protein